MDLVVTLDCDSDFSIVGKEIESGKVVVFPTDTVYGLGTNPRSSSGIKRCYEIKSRDRGKKMPVLVANLASADELVVLGDLSSFLASKFWPGKLSIILPAKAPDLPEELVGHDRTLAVRVPNHPCALRLISACGGSLVGTSANLSGDDPLTEKDDPRLLAFSTRSDFFVSGVCGKDSGKSSTVIDCTSEEKIRIVREGAIPAKTIFAQVEKMSSTDLS